MDQGDTGQRKGAARRGRVGMALEEALEIAMDAELAAQAFYAQAAVEIRDPGGRDLLGRLAAFEQYHYQQLAELARSLQETGQFIEYEPRVVEQFAPEAVGVAGTGRHGTGAGEAVATQLGDLTDEVSILAKAIENEKIAGERYRVLAEETSDPAGHDMFRKLANEEAIHQRILEDEFFSLSNQGVWGWSGLYGE